MGIFDRMGKVISSNINSLLDKAEDPKKSLELTIEEMGSSLKQAKKEIIEALGTQKRLAKKVEELDAEVEKWEKRAELALKSGDEELAREALKQKKRIIADRDRAEAMSAEQRGVVMTMKGELERMEHKHQELKSRKGTIANEMKRAKQGAGDPLSPGRGPGGGAFEDFRRMESKIDQARSEADAYSEIDAALNDGLSETELESKFAQLEGRGVTPDGKKVPDAVDEELERLKKKLRIGQ
ncbi:MAG TPA: PspA/IM30 family protein [Polyangiaceae bacterium]|jgi:phage shock protein A|nr:PspA/IM30 family protein [Polyangiaceae bacterium]